MGNEVSVKDLKEKFDTVQKIAQSLKEDSIRLESEIKTLESDYSKQLTDILELTGAVDLEGAVKAYESKKLALEQEKQSLEVELNSYLDTYAVEE